MTNRTDDRSVYAHDGDEPLRTNWVTGEPLRTEGSRVPIIVAGSLGAAFAITAVVSPLVFD